MAAQGFDRKTQMWLLSVLGAIGLAVAGVIWSEIKELRADKISNTTFETHVKHMNQEIGKIQNELDKDSSTNADKSIVDGKGIRQALENLILEIQEKNG